MIDFITNFNEDLEKTQRLPTLTAEVQLDEALQRERAAPIEIVELLRQNLQQAGEIEQLERLFEVCGALKETLSKVLGECRTRNVALSCGSAANRMLDNACYSLEQILSAPGFSAPSSCHADMPAGSVPRLVIVNSHARL